MISNAAMEFRSKIENPAEFLSTCDGGDPGSKETPSIWVLGIEPGWSLEDQAASEVSDAETDKQLDVYSVDLQLKWPFNRNAFKLLAAIEGRSPEDYRQFAECAQPFANGSLGYLKGNLFPVPFQKVSTWDEAATEMTGFPTKEEYKAWVRAVRFPVLKGWIENCRPRFLIGSGISHLTDFLEIAGANETPKAFQFEINGHTKRVFISQDGIVPVVIIPHLSNGIHSLNSNESISRTAEIIRSELGA